MRLIDADKVKIDSRKHCIDCKLNGTKHCKTCVINLICDRLDLQPTVEPDEIQAIMKDYLVYKCEPQKKGKWVKIFENPYTNGYVCPFCGHKIQVTEQFLPQVTECESCGADMRGDKNG